MGLDLTTKSGHRCRYGSYSSVHYFRVLVSLVVARACLRRYERLKHEEDLDAALLAANIANCEAKTNGKHRKLDSKRLTMGHCEDDHPNYDLFADDRYFDTPCTPEMAGLIKLVNHSDCDGYHSAGDVLDISVMFNFIKPHLTEDVRACLAGDDTGNSPEEITKWITKLAAYFRKAADCHEAIHYC